MIYAIAQYYPREALEAAARETYAPTVFPDPVAPELFVSPAPRCPDGSCPLGVANHALPVIGGDSEKLVAIFQDLEVDRDDYGDFGAEEDGNENLEAYHRHLLTLARVPTTGYLVANALYHNGLAMTADHWELIRAGDAFIDDFDAGLIPDLRAAFGLESVAA